MDLFHEIKVGHKKKLSNNSKWPLTKVRVFLYHIAVFANHALPKLCFDFINQFNQFHLAIALQVILTGHLELTKSSFFIWSTYI